MANDPTPAGPGDASRSSLRVAVPLVEFIEGEALPGTGVSADAFWTGLARLSRRASRECAVLKPEEGVPI